MSAESPRRVSRQSSTVLTAAVLTALLVWFSYWARAVIIPLALSIFLVHVLSPVVRALRRLRLGHSTSVLVTIAGATALTAVISVLLLWQIGSLVQELPDHREKIHAKVLRVSNWLNARSDGRWPALIGEFESLLRPPESGKPEPVPVVVTSEQPAWLNGAALALVPVVEFLTTAAITLVLTTFLLLSREDMRNRLLRLLGPQSLTATTRAFEDATVRISRYLRMQLLINTGYGVALTIALLLLGVQYAVLWGFFAMLMRYVPYIGTWIGLFPPLLASFAMSDSWMQPVLVAAIYAFLEIFSANVLEPRLYGQSLGLSEVSQVIAAIFWTFLWGPIGLILSCPMTACLLVLGKHVPQLHWLDVMLGAEEPLQPGVAFYQRLTARDREESWTIAEEYSRTHTAAELLDEVLVPALARTQSALDRGELGDADEAWIVATVREIAEELAPVPAVPLDLASSRVKLLTVPAAGPCDALAAELLAARLDPSRWEVSCMNSGKLASEVLRQVEALSPPAMLIVALAPERNRPIRYLAKKVQGAASEMKVIAGIWSGTEPTEHTIAELKNVGIADVTAKLSSAQSLLESLRPQLEHFQEQHSEKEQPVSVRKPIGTTSAEFTSVISPSGEGS